MINQIDHRKPCQDHYGNHYDSIKELAIAFNINPETLSRRLKVFGWSTEKALTTPVKKNGGQLCSDHTGRKFRSVTQMCEYWHIERKTYTYRVSHGMSIEEALTTPSRIKNEPVES